TVGLLLVCAAGPEPFRPKTRPCPLPGIPDREYSSGSTSRPAEAQSTVGLLVEVSAGAVVSDAANAVAIRTFAKKSVSTTTVDNTWFPTNPPVPAAPPIG